MRTLSVYNTISLDGYFTDGGGDMSWAHQRDAEWSAFVAGNAGGESQMLFGRITYDMMSSFWPTAQAIQMMPQVAKAMNESRKVVFSRTLTDATWRNTTLVTGDIVGAVKRMKAEPGPNLLIMGSGSIVAQLTQARLIDVYQIVVNPIVLGAGRSLFEGVKDSMQLRLTKSRSFSNGNVVNSYESAMS